VSLKTTRLPTRSVADPGPRADRRSYLSADLGSSSVLTSAMFYWVFPRPFPAIGLGALCGGSLAGAVVSLFVSLALQGRPSAGRSDTE